MEREDSQVVIQIVAMLISFAGLALRASCAPWPVRCLMLVILRRAEAVARFYALGLGVSAPAPIRICHDGTDELARLSLRFRMLAQMLLVAAARILRFSALPRYRGWPASHIDDMNVAEVLVKRTRPDTS